MEWINSIFDGTLSGGATFLIIGVVSVILLIVSVLLDGIFEAFDFGDGPLSLTTIAAFGSVFGFVGYASIGGGASVGMATLYGAIAGLLGGILAWWMSKFFANSDSTASIKAASLEGTIAQVILRIPGGESFGEVAITSNGLRHTFSALSKTPIATGSKVKVTSVLTNSSLYVEEITSDVTPEVK